MQMPTVDEWQTGVDANGDGDVQEQGGKSRQDEARNRLGKAGPGELGALTIGAT